MRKWFSHDLEKWADFKKKYEKELKGKKALLHKIKQMEREKEIVTLLYSAKDEEHNDAVVLMDISKK